MSSAAIVPPSLTLVTPPEGDSRVSLGQLVLGQWQRDGYGIPGASVQLKSWLRVPVHRDRDCPQVELVIGLHRNGSLFYASVDDPDVMREATLLYGVDELEPIAERYAVAIDDTGTLGRDVKVTELFTTPDTAQALALGAFRLWQCCQSILDHGAGWSNQYRRKGQ